MASGDFRVSRHSHIWDTGGVDNPHELAYIRKVFSWDATKAERNYEKHGVSFEEAASVFFDSKALDWEDREHLEEEQRWKRLGFSWRARLILVVYTLRRLTDGTETTRIISARQASRQEREVYAG